MIRLHWRGEGIRWRTTVHWLQGGKQSSTKWRRQCVCSVHTSDQRIELRIQIIKKNSTMMPILTIFSQSVYGFFCQCVCVAGFMCSRALSHLVCVCLCACMCASPFANVLLFSSFSSQTLQYCSHSSPGVFIERRVWTYLLLSSSPPSVSPSISCPPPPPPPSTHSAANPSLAQSGLFTLIYLHLWCSADWEGERERNKRSIFTQMYHRL